jgi:hypothetical protein
MASVAGAPLNLDEALGRGEDALADALRRHGSER